MTVISYIECQLDTLKTARDSSEEIYRWLNKIENELDDNLGDLPAKLQVVKIESAEEKTCVAAIDKYVDEVNGLVEDLQSAIYELNQSMSKLAVKLDPNHKLKF